MPSLLDFIKFRGAFFLGDDIKHLNLKASLPILDILHNAGVPAQKLANTLAQFAVFVAAAERTKGRRQRRGVVGENQRQR